MTPQKFRKKPVEIEAMHLTGTAAETMEVYHWIEENTQGSFDPDPELPRPATGVSIDPATGNLLIATLEGVMQAKYGDWIIRGVQGEFYPCKPDIFAATYDAVDEPQPGRWEVSQAAPGHPVHIVPLNDPPGHSETSGCHCIPHFEQVARSDGTFGVMHVHNAFDGRK